MNMERLLRIAALTLTATVMLWLSLDQEVRHAVWRGLPKVHAQAFTTIPINSNLLNAPGCTQLLAGVGTQAIRIESGLLQFGAGGTGQIVTIGMTSSNTNATGNSPACSTTFGNPTNAAPGSSGLLANMIVTTAGPISFPAAGSPALITPTSNALIIILDTTNKVGGYITVLQQ